VRPAGLLPAGVLVLNRPRTRGVRLVAPLPHRVRLKSQTRLRKVSGGPRDCGVSNEILILLIHSPSVWSFSSAVCMHLLFFLTALVIALCAAPHSCHLSSTKITGYSMLLMGDHEYNNNCL